MTQAQLDNLNDIRAAGGLSICCDSFEDLTELEGQLSNLLWAKHNG